MVLACLQGAGKHSLFVPPGGHFRGRVYCWSKEFLEVGKCGLAGDTARQATSPEVKDLRSESAALKEVIAKLTLDNRLLKNMIGDGEDLIASPAFVVIKAAEEFKDKTTAINQLLFPARGRPASRT